LFLRGDLAQFFFKNSAKSDLWFFLSQHFMLGYKCIAIPGLVKKSLEKLFNTCSKSLIVPIGLSILLKSIF